MTFPFEEPNPLRPLARFERLSYKPSCLSALLLSICLFSPLGIEAAPRYSAVKDCLEHSAFVFIGTVTEPGASTMPPIARNDSTFVVSVDDTIFVPKALRNPIGQPITLVSEGAAHVSLGERFFFFVTGFLYGPSMAAREACRIPLEPDSLAIRGYITQIQSDIAEGNLRKRLQAAETVVLGRVISIAPFSGGTPQPSIGSEHNPDWWEAQVQVLSTEKGLARVSIRALFAHSLDMAWLHAPKLVAGQDTVLILDRIPIREFATDQLAVTHPLDVQSPADLDSLRVLLRRVRIR
jgi:hypothetical protein